MHLTESYVSINTSVIDGNNVNSKGGAFYVLSEKLSIYMCEFAQNKVRLDDGAIFASETHTEVHTSEFITNEAGHDGGAVSITDHDYVTVSIMIKRSMFKNNKADGGAAISMMKVATAVNDCDFFWQQSWNGSASESNINLSGSITVANNIGSVFLFNSELKFNIRMLLSYQQFFSRYAQ